MYDPESKGKVESSIKYLRKDFSMGAPLWNLKP
jgi:transposase